MSNPVFRPRFIQVLVVTGTTRKWFERPTVKELADYIGISPTAFVSHINPDKGVGAFTVTVSTPGGSEQTCHVSYSRMVREPK